MSRNIDPPSYGKQLAQIAVQTLPLVPVAAIV